MTKNNILHKAKVVKFDEFYTRYETIDKEIKHYYEYDKNVFRDKVILCPCDDPESSEFVNYFRDNFDTFGIKKLIFTSYSKQDKYDVIDLLNGAKQELNRGKLLILDRINIKENINWSCLEGDGDFRSEEVQKYLKESDMIITNPPFSLFREFIKWIMDAKKEFIVLGSLNAVTYKEIFPYIKDNKIWLGYSISGGDVEFKIPKGTGNRKSKGFREDSTGQEYTRVFGVRWFTNIPYEKKYKEIQYMKMDVIKKLMIDNEKFNMFAFKKYDNYDAIEVPECRYIPDDYYEPMGVPISFLDKYNPKYFDILDCLNDYPIIERKFDKYKNKITQINGKIMYARLVIRRKKL